MKGCYVKFVTKCDVNDARIAFDCVLPGLGMPDAALASIPEPLFFAITDDTVRSRETILQLVLFFLFDVHVVDNIANYIGVLVLIVRSRSCLS